LASSTTAEKGDVTESSSTDDGVNGQGADLIQSQTEDSNISLVTGLIAVIAAMGLCALVVIAIIAYLLLE
jgi:hypothetical protein